MKVLLILLTMLLSSTAYTQQRVPPSPPRQLPGRDAVMAIDYIPAGGSKQYNWQGNKGKIEMTSVDDNGGNVDIWMDKKALLTNYKLAQNKKAIPLSLTKKVNRIIIAAHKTNSKDIVKAAIELSGGGMTYHINIDCSRSLKDTIIIKR